MNPGNGQIESLALAKGKKPRYTTLWLWLILLLGLGLRVTGLTWGQAYCYGSQSDCLEAYTVAVDYAHGEPGAQYLGQPNFNESSKLPGPLWAMFCAAGLRIWGSIDGVAWLIIFLNTAVIYLTYLLAVCTVGHRAALWAALLIATSPAAVAYSVVVFNPAVMSFLGACLFLALWRVTRQDRSWAAFWIFFLPLVMLQFHMSGLMLIPAVMVVLVLCPVRVNYPWLAGGILAGFALCLPYVCGEMAHGWENTRAMISGGRAGYSVEALKVFSAPWTFLINYWLPRWSDDPNEYREIGRACFGSYGFLLAINLVSVSVSAFLVIGILGEIKNTLCGTWRSVRAVCARSPGIVFLTTLFIVPLIFGLVEGKRFHARYCLVLLAPLFSLAGVATVRWLALPRVGRIFFLIVLVTTCANVWFLPAMFRFQGRCIEQGTLFLPSFHKLETVYQCLKAHAGKDRLIQVEDADYLKSLPSGDRALRYVSLIQEYVACREKETALPSGSPAPPLIYKLLPADRVNPGDPAVAYRGQGIALAALPSAP